MVTWHKNPRKYFTFKKVILTLLSPIAIWGVWYYGYVYPIKAQTCFTVSEVQADARCLYILQNHVFEKGTRSNPHKGNACGSDVTAYIPSFHFTNQFININALTLDPKYQGEICVNPTATPVPTNTPVPSNSPTPIACTPTQPGDTNCDNKADLADFETWRREYLGQLTTKLADFDHDGFVYLSDFETWRKKYLKLP